MHGKAVQTSMPLQRWQSLLGRDAWDEELPAGKVAARHASKHFVQIHSPRRADLSDCTPCKQLLCARTIPHRESRELGQHHNSVVVVGGAVAG